MEDKKYHVGYIRVSTNEQVDEGYSLERQEEIIRRMFEYDGIKDFIIISDEGQSAFKKSLKIRPGFKKIQELIDKGQLASLYVTKLDRFSRNIRDTIFFIDDNIGENGNLNFVFKSKNDNLDFSTMLGKMQIYLISMFAQLESEQISHRTKEGLIGKASLGKYPFGNTPLGFSKDDEDFLVENENIKLVKRTFELYNQGNSCEAVADFINIEIKEGKLKFYENTKKISAFNNTIAKNKVRQKTIERMIDNTIYQGIIKISGEKIKLFEPMFWVDENRVAQKKQSKFKEHIYPYANKVYINDKLARQSTQMKKTKKYIYYSGENSNEITDQKRIFINVNQINSAIVSKYKKLRKNLNAKKLNQISKSFLNGEIYKNDFIKMRDTLFNKTIDYEKIKRIDIILKDNKFEDVKVIF